MRLWYWHAYHDALLTRSDDPDFFANRAQEIDLFKPPEQLELRMRLFKVVRGALPRILDELWAEKEEWEAEAHTTIGILATKKATVRAAKRYQLAMTMREEIMRRITERSTRPDVMALHDKECPNCPWNGKSILAEEDKT